MANRGPCTPETERCRTAQKYAFDTSDCCKGHVTHILLTLRDAFQAEGIPWWLDYGSILGAVRHGGMIPHDKDGDAGFLGEDWPRLHKLFGLDPDHEAPKWRQRVNVETEWNGLWVIWKWPRRGTKFGAGDSIKVCLSRKNRTNVDLFPWYRRQDGQRFRKFYVGVDRFKGREFDETHLLPLTTLPYDGHPMPVPADPEWFCEHRYGPGWKNSLRKNNDGRLR